MSSHSPVQRGMRPLLHAGAALALASVLTQCSDLPVQPDAPDSAESAPGAVLFESRMSCIDERDAPLPSGAPYQVCANPAVWNGDLLVFVPGYTNPAANPSTPSGDIEGLSAAQLVTSIGYAWATTGFRDTGLLVPDTWIGEDLLAVVERARSFLQHRVNRVYLAGGSQGGLVTTLAVERFPGVFTGGGLALCGPIGSYRRQLEYVGDFRVVFDFYFGPVITAPDWPVWTDGSPLVDPADWNDASRAAVADAVHVYPERTANLLSVTRAPIDTNDAAATTLETVLGLLRYSFIGTNDAIAKLGGLAYGNLDRAYSGSGNDAALNAGVERFAFDAAAAPALQRLETTGVLRRVLVTMHTTGDAIVPEWQQSLYRNKTSRSLISWLLHQRITIGRYGHCSFTPEEVLGGFALLVLKTSGRDLVVPASALRSPNAQREFLRAARGFGASPQIVWR